MGLILYSLDGLRIQHVKNWVLRCHACYTITKDMTKKFCPQCGNATLIRTSTSLDPATGHVIYHLKRNFQYKLRGTQYSIPPPKGGRDHQRDLILREDQKEYQHALKQSRHVAKKKAAAGTDLFDMDYVPLNGDRKSPHGAFVVIGHGRKNPNEARRKRK